MIAMLLGMFIFGEMGVLQSYDKAARISSLRTTIWKLHRILDTKNEVLKKVRANPELARHYRPWRGYSVQEERGGAGRAGKPFLLRHPLLILLLAAIAALSLLFFLQSRKRRRLLPADPAPRSRGTYIKPSWS